MRWHMNWTELYVTMNKVSEQKESCNGMSSVCQLWQWHFECPYRMRWNICIAQRSCAVQCIVLFCTVQVCVSHTISIVPKESQWYWTITHAAVGEHWSEYSLQHETHTHTHTHTYIYIYQVSFPLSVQNFSVWNKHEQVSKGETN